MDKKEIDELFTYDPVAGQLISRRTTGKWRKGKPVGQMGLAGYLIVRPKQRVHLVHRLIWKLIKKEIPLGYVIDHIDGDTLNNRITNLRLATRTDNQQNMKRYSTNTSGYTGVCLRRDTGKWQADIKVNGIKINLGCFETAQSASIVRKQAEAAYGFHPNHGRVLPLQAA